MSKATTKNSVLTDTEIRTIMLRYFYDRNQNATSERGKKGTAVKIRNIKADLKNKHQLSQQQVQRNLTYLLSQGWVEKVEVQKQIRAKGGTLIPSTATYYKITAAGIDKIDGPGEFTMPKFHGVKIEATGQNIITLGDGNQVNARFSDLGKALVDLRNFIVNSRRSEAEKMSLVADIDTIQSQLAKPQPNSDIIKAAWVTVETAATIDGCASLVGSIAGLIGTLVGF